MSERYVPAEIAAQIRLDMLERIKASLVARAAELAALARSDPAAFDRAWEQATDQAIADATEHAREQIRAWAAPERQWRTEQ